MTRFYVDFTKFVLRPNDAFQRKKDLIKKVASMQQRKTYTLYIRDLEDPNLDRWRRYEKELEQLATELQVDIVTEYVVAEIPKDMIQQIQDNACQYREEKTLHEKLSAFSRSIFQVVSSFFRNFKC